MNTLFQHLTVPDLWQQEAVNALREGKDVVVHAPTGAGKTYIFEVYQPELKGQAVFTVPTRALANDKLAEWRVRGWDVGIATGDLALRLDAHIVVATLETQRARFIRRDGPQLLVVDEYQMIGDPHRGVNYELALALAPRATQILLLSGSVGNPHDVVSWLRRIGRDAVLVTHDVRPVPLTEVDLESLPNRTPQNVRGYWPRLIANALRADLGPILMFAPRRKAAEDFAQSIASALPDAHPLILSPEQEALAGPKLSRLLCARVAFHHSGLSYAQRAGIVEPLAKNGQLRVVVATMGLAAGINFSMRSVVVTDTRYMVGNIERQVQADELLQMFGRAGRRGLDDAGYVLYNESAPRLLNARPRQLRRATKLDWPTLIAVMDSAVSRGENAFSAAIGSSRRLFAPQDVPLGVEHSRETGPMPCGFQIDMERARFIRRAFPEMQNSRGEWQPAPAAEAAPIRDAWVFQGERWRPALSIPSSLDGLRVGTVCRLDVPGQRRYGREIGLGSLREGRLFLARWLRREMRTRVIVEADLSRIILDRLPQLVKAAFRIQTNLNDEAVAAKPAPLFQNPPFTVAGIFTRGEQLLAHLDISAHTVSTFCDSEGRALITPPLREVTPPCCMTCVEAPWCRSVEITATPAWIWRRLGLITPFGTPTRRGIVFSFFHHGEGLAIAAALEDGHYPIGDLVFDLANLRAGPRFAGDDSPFSGKLGAICQRTYERADLDGYLSMGVPVEYGAGASEVVRDIVEHGLSIGKLQTEMLRTGDIERALIEWRSVLRHVALAPDYDWDRWRALRRAASEHVESSAARRLPELPPLTAAQRKGVG